MNRAEKRRQKKRARKVAKNTKPGQMANRSPEQQTKITQEALERAIQHHTAGDLPQAEDIYRQILNTDPDQLVALHFLGLALKDMGRLDEAVDSFYKTIALKPDYAEAHYNLGNALRELGKLDEAIAGYHKALAIKPDYTGAHNNLGLALQNIGKLEEAVASYNKAVAIKPDLAEAHFNLGNVLLDQDKLDEAIASYHKALAIKPDFAEAHYNLGNAFQELGKLDEAFTCQRRAVALNPQDDLFWAGLAGSLNTISFTSVDDDLWQILSQLTERPTVHPSFVTGPIIRALRHHPKFMQILELTGTGKPETGIDYGDVAERLSAIPLFLRIMHLNPINDLEIERMLTILRRAMIKQTGTGKTDEKGLPFSAALALQCYTNEYVFPENDEEKAAIENLQQQITTLVEKALDIPPFFIAALGAYRPLSNFP
jgi:tetratricopeptide (TPR) repeat protein